MKVYFKVGCKKNMCKKIKELKGLSSGELLAKTGQLSVLPIDVAQICYDLKIRTQAVDFDTLENEEEIKPIVKKKGQILGAVVVKDEDVAILYRETDSLNRRRFTIAHELAHCCLHMPPEAIQHIEFRTDESSDSKDEIEANKFAGELLIPENLLRELIGNTKSVTEQALLILSSTFVVSKNVMEARLKTLGITVS